LFRAQSKETNPNLVPRHSNPNTSFRNLMIKL
jgi:hypothetical protein